jgi:peptidoglycan/xylan/chitin deacetylase (PgdA/CDA1 family)
MMLDKSHQPPNSSNLKHGPGRLPLSRRIKHWGMKTAGQLASVLRHLPRKPSEDEFGILAYHRVAPIQPNCPPPTINVTPDRFREQITGLVRQGFKFLPLEEVLRKCAARESLPPRTTVLTFDDGFESVYEYAWPTLRELKIPSTIFLTTGFLNAQTPFPFDAWGRTYSEKIPPISYRPLSHSQCVEMIDSDLVELGAHTHTHADFRNRDEEFRADMELCLEHFEKHFGITRPSFAFPFGKPSLGFARPSSINVARELGVTCALTTEAVSARTSDSPFSWGRFNVYDWDTSKTVAAKLLGYYSWAPLIAERAVQLWKKRPRYAALTAASFELCQLAGDCYD